MSATDESTSSGHRVERALAGWRSKADKLAIENIRTMTGADISAHKPEDLRVVDNVLDHHFRDTERRRNELASAAVVIGTYLGEVFVRNISARWHRPGWLRAVQLFLSRNEFLGENYFYVELGREKVLVFKAAHDAIENTAAVFSLYEFYLHYSGERA